MAASIKAIDTTSVHRIHSGQVVLDLQSCLKELVENALDAEVRIKDHGLSTIEVSDNGSGISAVDWASIGLKHHTSKLPDLALLPTVTTFGFRGEAVSALCALCEAVTIVTSTKEMEPMGAVIQLGRDGRVLDDTGRVARPRGTTITLTNLFHPLPVRRKEFERNAKRELTKALTLLTAYALVPASFTASSPGVRLKLDSFTSGTGKSAKRSTLLANDGRGSLRACIMAVWGSKALDGVTDVDLELAVEADKMVKRELGQGTQGGQGAHEDQIVRIKGVMSSAAWGQGRSAPDRQYLYVNGRPADLKSVQKVVNETYKSFNTHQVPLAILDFTIPGESVDINVSPDKRTIMLHSESNLLTALRLKLEEFFAPTRNSYAVEGATQTVRGIKATQSRLDMAATRPEGEESTEEIGAGEQLEAETDGITPSPGLVGAHLTGAAASSTGCSIPDSILPSVIGSAALRERLSGSSRINADAGPSRAPRSSRDVVMVLDEDAEGESEQSETQHQHETSSGRRFRQRQNQSATNQGNQRPPVVAVTTISPSSPAPSRKRTTGTISTAHASWSPDRPSPSQKVGIGGVRGQVSGREARKSLKERLKMYSQAVPTEEDGEDDGETGGHEDRNSGGEDEDEDIDMADQAAEAPDSGSDRRSRRRTDDDAEEEGCLVAGSRGGGSGSEADSETQRPLPDEVKVDSANGMQPTLDVDMGTNGEDLFEPYDVPQNGSAASENGEQQLGPPTASTAPLTAYRSEIPSTAISGEITLSFSLPRLRARYDTIRQSRSKRRFHTAGPAHLKDALSRGGVTSEAGIANRDLQSAEEALVRVISKADFGRMEVVGQFNKGFIIARLRRSASPDKREDAGTDDLFIVDQHASDEKFNFETLQRTTRIKGQALIKPRPLELTAADELMAIENVDVLRANGFEVAVDEEKAPGRGERVRLVAMPVSKETVFDFKDLEQLLHLLSDSAHASGQMVRCTKARSMFAMRACRKSVMIGKSLTKGQMTQLLRNMGTIDQPWNCPHGRPTMRHLTKIDAGRRDMGERKVDWSSWSP